MAIPLYLAMTAAEFSRCGDLPERLAWMSCRFSPCGKGLSNLPPALPEGALLILDDQNTPDGHDADLIRQQLLHIITENRCCGLLLDFQHPGDTRLGTIAKALMALPCPVCVSHFYARELDCPVFLPPCPLTVPLAAYLAPWQGREIWLEAALEQKQIVITEKGSSIFPSDIALDTEHVFYDEGLRCRYQTQIDTGKVCFTLHRGKDELHALLEDARQLGINNAIGLYQEFGM